MAGFIKSCSVVYDDDGSHTITLSATLPPREVMAAARDRRAERRGTMAQDPELDLYLAGLEEVLKRC